MKANAPEKLYLHPTAKGNVGASWLIFSLTNEDIEYIRTDAFIEKAAEWLHLYLQTHLVTEVLTGKHCEKELMDDFKKAMKL